MCSHLHGNPGAGETVITEPDWKFQESSTRLLMAQRLEMEASEAICPSVLNI